MYKTITLFFILSLIFFVSNSLLFANEEHKTVEHGHEAAKAEEHGAAPVHEAAVTHTEESHGISVLYFVYWAGLISLLVLAGRYVASVKNVSHDSHAHGEHHAGGVQHTDSNLPKILIALGVGLYFLDQFPAIKHYHEPSMVGFTRFLLKFSAGILMTISAFTWMHAHHEEH